MQHFLSSTCASRLAFILLAGFGMAWHSATLAQPASTSAETTRETAEGKAPDEVVRNAVTRVRELINENSSLYTEDSTAFYAMIDREIVPHFDMPYISRLVLGRHARGASTEQRGSFAAAFKKTLMRTYADAMLEYNASVKTEFKPLRLADDAEQATVETRLMLEDGSGIPVSFVMHQVDGRWQIYDISVEGISLVTNFRAQFNQRIREQGLDALIKQLEDGNISPEVANS